MSSIVWDTHDIAFRLSQLRGEIPSGRVFVPLDDGRYVQGVDPKEYPTHNVVGAHVFVGKARTCRDCGTDFSAVNTCFNTCGGQRPANWRMEQHKKAEKAKEPPKKKPIFDVSIMDLLREAMDKASAQIVKDSYLQSFNPSLEQPPRLPAGAYQHPSELSVLTYEKLKQQVQSIKEAQALTLSAEQIQREKAKQRHVILGDEHARLTRECNHLEVCCTEGAYAGGDSAVVRALQKRRQRMSDIRAELRKIEEELHPMMVLTTASIDPEAWKAMKPDGQIVCSGGNGGEYQKASSVAIDVARGPDKTAVVGIDRGGPVFAARNDVKIGDGTPIQGKNSDTWAYGSLGL